MARNLKTGWVILATSGSVVDGQDDGRTVKKEWLEDMAETFNTNVFTPQIWPDHKRYYSMGNVIALKVEPATDPELKGEIHLYGILQPSDALISANRYGDFKFPSIEVGENYRGNGKFYLKGIGATDQPASSGVTELKFSHKGSEEKALVFSGKPFNLDADLESESKNTILNRIFSKITQQPNVNDEESPQMNEQLEKIAQILEAQATQFTAMTKRLDAHLTPESPEASQQPEENDDEGISESFSQFKSSVEKTQKDLSEKMDNVLAEFKKLANDPAPGTDTPEGQGDNGAQEII